ncbi:hypothetical protein B0I37DRAFT_386584 [Chaetomium sp. MPI-CAGE-AT-0009]|nr:hypothetical protein B0I37DRAFT_386584 [Chaetomium sp. MPI-CAGE-AT-0009]
MPTSPLENIPVELLTGICEYVGLSHRPSLLSFALSSKRCHSVAKRLLFHTIKVSVPAADSPGEWEFNIAECIRILERNASFADVRTLVITGPRRDTRNYWHDDDVSEDALTWAAHGNTRSWSFGLPLSLSELVDGDKDRLQGLERRSTLLPTEHEYMSEAPDVTILTGTWQLLGRLVQMLQGLGDVLYAVRSPMPPCLLQSLLQYQPRCRLHVFTLTLRSLQLPETDRDELALVTAPCLYSVWMWYSETDGLDADGEPSYHAEAIYSMVKGLAPNLKQIHLFRTGGSSFSTDTMELFPPAPPWKGFTNVGEELAYMPAQLETLELGLDVYDILERRLDLDKEVAESWIADTNLSSLHALRISRIVSCGALDSLMRANSFPCLTTLLFTCAEKQENAYYNDIKEFIHRLPQLTSLEIRAWPPNISLTASLPHGLRELWLRTKDVLGQSLDEEAILELATRCPRIDTLALKIRRSRGDAAEVALYRALGRFPNLRCLGLTLDAFPPPWFETEPPRERVPGDTRFPSFDTPVDPSFDDYDSQYLRTDLYPYRNGHIRDVFINMAVDETLARSIFNTICTAKASTYSDSAALVLERVMIQPAGGRRSFPQPAIMAPRGLALHPYQTALSRRWLLERDVRDDARHMVHAREIGREARLQSGFRRIGNYMDYMPIFRRIWPETPGVEWEDDWQSWPLAETA